MKSIIKKIRYIAFLGLVVLVNASSAYAQVGISDTTFGKSGGKVSNLPKLGADAKTAERSFGIIMEKFTGILFMFAGAVAIYFIIMSGFQMIKARGEEEGLSKAKQQLMWSILGFLLVILAYTLVVNITAIVYTTINPE